MGPRGTEPCVSPSGAADSVRRTGQTVHTTGCGLGTKKPGSASYKEGKGPSFSPLAQQLTGPP